MFNWCAIMSCEIKGLNFCRNAHFQRTGPHPLLVDFDLMASASWRIFFLIITRSHARITSQGNVFGSHGWQRLLLAKNGTRRCGSLSKRPGTCKHRNSLVFRRPNWVSNWRRILLFAWQPDQPNHETNLQVFWRYIYIFMYMNIFHILVASRWCLPLAKHVKELCDGISNDTGDVFFHRHGCPRHGEI